VRTEDAVRGLLFRRGRLPLRTGRPNGWRQPVALAQTLNDLPVNTSVVGIGVSLDCLVQFGGEPHRMNAFGHISRFSARPGSRRDDEGRANAIVNGALPLAGITAAAKQLEIVQLIRAANTRRDDVIGAESILRSAPKTTVAVSLLQFVDDESHPDRSSEVSRGRAGMEPRHCSRHAMTCWLNERNSLSAFAVTRACSSSGSRM
jgi:hypothetical protein